MRHEFEQSDRISRDFLPVGINLLLLPPGSSYSGNKAKLKIELINKACKVNVAIGNSNFKGHVGEMLLKCAFNQ